MNRILKNSVFIVVAILISFLVHIFLGLVLDKVFFKEQQDSFVEKRVMDYDFGQDKTVDLGELELIWTWQSLTFYLSCYLLFWFFLGMIGGKFDGGSKFDKVFLLIPVLVGMILDILFMPAYLLFCFLGLRYAKKGIMGSPKNNSKNNRVSP